MHQTNPLLQADSFKSLLCADIGMSDMGMYAVIGLTVVTLGIGIVAIRQLLLARKGEGWQVSKEDENR